MSEKLEFMLLALEYSRQALPECRPNPPVGCVIVHKGDVVSKGFTYVAIEDPHPRNRGKGLNILKNAGISYTPGIGKQEVEDFLSPYLVKPS